MWSLLESLGLHAYFLPLFIGFLLAAFVKRLFGGPRFFVTSKVTDVQSNFILISGCDTGFGRALSVRLLKEGLNVISGCFTQEGRESLNAEAKALPGRLYTVSLDITDQSSVDQCFGFVEKVLSQHKCKLWSLVNNAGFSSLHGPNDWVTIDEYKQSIDINLLGTVRMTQKFIPLLKQSKGRIVTMISAYGRIHGFYTAPYVTAKFGVQGFMDSVRLELRPFGVTAHILEPGAFKTQLLNKEEMLKRIDQIWKKLPQEIKDEYGEEFRKNFIDQWMSGVDLVANPDLSEVIQAYVHSLTSTSPKIRYTCGADARFLFIPLSFLPGNIQDAILSFLPKLQFGPALIPAAAIQCPTVKKPKVIEDQIELTSLHMKMKDERGPG